MDVKNAYQQMLDGGMSPEEAIQTLQAELEKLLAMGEIQEDEFSQAIAELESMANGANGQKPNTTEEATVEGEPIEEEMMEQPEMESESMEEPKNEEVPGEDKFALRADELVGNGEFEDFNEAYDYAMDEESMNQGNTKMNQVHEVAEKFLNNQIDENQVLEMLRMLKAQPLNNGGNKPTQQPPQKNMDELKY